MFSLKDLQDMYAKIDYSIHHGQKNRKASQQHTNFERNLKDGKHAAELEKVSSHELITVFLLIP